VNVTAAWALSAGKQSSTMTISVNTAKSFIFIKYSHPFKNLVIAVITVINHNYCN
jgi:hypothetical protein